MQIVLNGKETEIEGKMKITEFLKLKDLSPDRIVVEYNYEILKKEDWDKVTLKENDNLEVLSFVGGG